MTTNGTITVTDADAFVRRFGRLDDGFMRELVVSRQEDFVRLELDVKDSERKGKRLKLRITFTGVRHAVYNQGPRTGLNAMITEALNACFMTYEDKNYLFFDFAPVHTDELSSVESMHQLSIKDFFESNGLVVAEAASWVVTPLP